MCEEIAKGEDVVKSKRTKRKDQEQERLRKINVTS